MREPFIKVFYPRDFDSLIVGDQAAAIIDVHSRGIDRAWMDKKAAAGVFKDLALAPEKGYSFIHLIALGDAEKYAGNRNGDIFYGFPRTVAIPYPEKRAARELQVCCGNADRMSTFEKHAKVYRNHCFTAGTPVLDGTAWAYRPIDEFKVGDLVVTHEGRPRRILRVYKHKAPDGVRRLRAVGVLRDVFMTDEHPVLVVRYDAVFCEKRGSLSLSTNKCFPRNAGAGDICAERGCDRPASSTWWDPEWMPAKYIRPGDYVVFPRTYLPAGALDDIITCDDDAYFYGLLYAEGSFSRRVTAGKERFRMDLTIGAHEEPLRDWVARYLDAAHVTWRGPYLHKGNHTLMFQITDARVRSAAERLFGGVTYSHERRLCAAVVSLPLSRRLALLAGALDGDGHYHAENRCARLRTTSFDGMHDFVRLAHSAGIAALPVRDSAGGKISKKYKGRTYISKPSGVVYFSHSQLQVLRPFSKKLERSGDPDRADSCSSFISRAGINTRITQIEAVKASAAPGFDGYVYNLEVEDDNSYIVAGFSVHNCNKKDSPSYGSIVKAAHNKDMGRGELIIRVKDSEWSDDLEKLASGHPIDFSMAARVPYDTCSRCAHRAHSRDEYCDHAANHLTAITKEGHQIGVINDYHTFFDISRVPVRADRIAQGLLKAASPAPTSRDLLTEMEFNPPPAYEGIANDFTRMKKLSVLQRMAAIEKEIAAQGDSILGDATAKSLVKETLPDLAQEDMALLAGGSSDTVEHKLAALADAKVILSLGDFMKVVTGQSNAARLGEETEAAEARLPGIFNRMLSSSDVEDMLDGTLFDDTTLGVVPQKIKDLVGSLAQTHGRSGDAARRRVTITVVRALPATRKQEKNEGQEKTAAFSKAAGRIAEEYAKYLLAVCARGNNAENRMLTESAIMQHYVC